MSGGHFDYKEWAIDDIASQIDHLVYSNEDSSLTDWGTKKGHFFSKETIEQFVNARDMLRVARIYATRIDYLVSGDDDEKTFHERLQYDLDELVDLPEMFKKEPS